MCGNDDVSSDGGAFDYFYFFAQKKPASVSPAGGGLFSQPALSFSGFGVSTVVVSFFSPFTCPVCLYASQALTL